VKDHKYYFIYVFEEVDYYIILGFNGNENGNRMSGNFCVINRGCMLILIYI